MITQINNKQEDKMKLIEILNQYYPEESQKLKQKFPTLYEFSKEVEVIEWQEEFQIADRNPELFDNLQVIELMFKSNLITEEEYRREIGKLMQSGYASKTMGVAFIDNKEIAFREKVPSIRIILHELGHIYFKVSDLTWNATYGGAEILIHFALLDMLNITEEQIRDYIAIYTLVYLSKLEKIEEIEKIIVSNIAKPLNLQLNRLIPLLLLSGTLPSGEIEEGKDILYREYDPNLIQKHIDEGKIKFNLNVLKSSLLTFISAYLQDGIRYQDPFLQRFSIEYFNNIDKILSEILKLYGISIKDFRKLEKDLGSERVVYELLDYQGFENE